MLFKDKQKKKLPTIHQLSHQGAISLLFALLAVFWFIVIFKYTGLQKVNLYTEKCTDFSYAWYYVENGNHVYVSLPTTRKNRIPTDADGYARIYCDMPTARITDFSIGFFTKHQLYTVTVGNQLLESYDDKNFPPWMQTTGCYYHVVSIPQNMGTINKKICIAEKTTIRALPAGIPNIEYTQGIFSEVKRGSRSSLLNYFVKRNLFKSIVSAVIFLLSLILLGIAYIFRKQLNGDHTLRALGYLTILVGCWLLEKSFITQLLYENPIGHWLFEYLFFITMPITFYYFIEELSGVHNDVGMGVLTYVDIGLICLHLLLQVTGVCSIAQSEVLTVGMIFISFGHVVYFFIRENKRRNARLKGYFPAFIVVLVGTIIEMAHYYINSYETTNVMPITFLIFFVFLGVQVYGTTVRKIQDLADSATYHKLAFIDFSTGVYNRTAYYTFVEKYRGAHEQYCSILFDMNNLKRINDSYGHLYGDKVIKTFSDCAQRAFGAYGKVYRIGGDEFLTLIHNPSQKQVDQACADFEQNVAEQQEVQYKFTVAYGVAYFEADTGEDFFSAQKFADGNMYKMKMQMKKDHKIESLQKVTDCG